MTDAHQFSYNRKARSIHIADSLMMALRIDRGANLVAVIGAPGDCSNYQAVVSWVERQLEDMDTVSDQVAFQFLKGALLEDLTDKLGG